MVTKRAPIQARMKNHFNGLVETHLKPKILTTYEQLVWVAQYKTLLKLNDRDGGVGDPSKEHGVKCWNVLHNLPY